MIYVFFTTLFFVGPTEPHIIITHTYPAYLMLLRPSLRKSFTPSLLQFTKLLMTDATPEEYVTIVEGQASMLYAKKEAVFYNKVQVLNRDVSIQTIRLFAEQRIKEKNDKMAKNHPNHPKCDGITVLDALAATGLRSIRYLKEIPGVSHVTINDLLPEATAQALANVQRNDVDQSRVSIETGDAIMLMYNHREHEQQYDVIDLDPYGSASPFIDSAVQAVADGGLLCVTCTDMPVLSGNYPETCFAKYGNVSIKAPYHAEHALRTLLQTLDSAANKYSRYIVPYMSLAIDFYCRVFVRVFKSPVEVSQMKQRGWMHWLPLLQNMLGL